MSRGILSQASFAAPPETPLGKALDQRRTLHGEKIRSRLAQIQLEAGCLTIDDIVGIAREGFVEGAAAMGEILTEVENGAGGTVEIVEFQEKGLPRNVVKIPNLEGAECWHG
jgi:hypothetical protein